jgi:multiple sugar transport system substrate-binding protein
MGEWFAYWADLRKAGGCVPPDVQALDRGSNETAMISQGKAATAFEHSNMLVAYQALSKSTFTMTMYPQGGPGSKPGQYLKPSQMWSVYARTRSPDEAARIVDFFVRDPQAAHVLKVERGVPASAAIRALITGELDPIDRESVDYVSLVSSRVGPLPPPPPNGAGEVAQALQRINEEVGFGKRTPTGAGQQFVSEAASILSRG